ncbi:MAG: hypothetical protein LBM93_04925 [Oscillospiraceae bacterium]|jgi:hypothetical protein|nr:hypothetical protein [Oscillospiraceae bacterium]
MAILHCCMPNLRRRLTFISNGEGKTIPQFGFCFSRSSKEISSDNSTEWNYIIRGEKSKFLVSCFSRAMVWVYKNNTELYNALNSELDELLLTYDKSSISPSIGEYLFPLIIFSKMPDNYFKQDKIYEELKKPIHSAISVLNKFQNENKMSSETAGLFSECLLKLYEVFPLTGAEQMSALLKNSTTGGFSIDDIKQMQRNIQKLTDAFENLNHKFDDLSIYSDSHIRELYNKISTLEIECSKINTVWPNRTKRRLKEEKKNNEENNSGF